MKTIALLLFLLFQGIPLGPPFAHNICGSPVSGMKLWYSADCITFISSVCGTPTTGSTISAWADRSGNGNNATVLTSTCTFNTAQINSLPAITNNGSCGLSYPGVGAGIATVFAVMRVSSTGNNTILGVSPTTAGAPIYGSGNSSKEQYFVVTNGGFSAVVNGTATQDTNWHQMNLWVNTAGVGTNIATMRLDRAADGTSGFPNIAYTAANNRLMDTGNGVELTGQIAELIYYNSQLSSPDITTNETYLNCRYGL